MNQHLLSPTRSRTLYPQMLSFPFKITMFICYLWLPFAMYAEPISEKQARQLASEFFNRNTIRTVQVKKVATASECGRKVKQTESATGTSYYIFTPDNGKGFVIISGDDEMKPIIGYSLTNTFDATRMPAQLTAYLDSYEKGFAEMRQNHAVQGRTAGGKAVAPLITTQWSQETPYNLLCGKYGGTYFPAGCLTTAVAQVMKYYNFPAKGNGAAGHRTSSDPIDLSQSVYDWKHMKDSYQEGTYNDTEARAVALLMRDVGFALWTYYTPEGSSAYSAYIAPSLYKHFNYSKDIRYLIRECYTSQDWINIIRENLSAGQPIVYCAGHSTGHSFVCDGIDNNDYLHINWGWSGDCDGYFDIDAFAPYGTDIFGKNLTLYADHQMVVNIHPGDPDADNSAYESPLLVWGLKAGEVYKDNDYVYSTPKSDKDVRASGNSTMKFGATFKLLNNTRATTNYDEYLYFGSLYDENKQLIKRFDLEHGIRGRLDRDKYIEAGINFDFTNIADGNYYVSMWYKRDKNRDGHYEDREFDFACDPYLPVTVKDGRIHLESDNTTTDEPLEIISVEQPHTIYENVEYGYLKLAIRNNGNELFKNKNLNIYCVPENEAVENPDISTLTETGTAYIEAIYDGATVTFPGSIRKKLNAGRYRLYFSYYKDKETLVQDGKKHFIDVAPLPDNIPFVLTQPLVFESSSYENSDHEWMEIKTYYMATGHCMDFWNGKHDVQIWAAPTSNPEDKILLFESLDEYTFSHTNYYTYATITGNPDLFWKATGEYRVWLKVRSAGEKDWIEIDIPNNTGTFNVTEYKPFGPILHMTAPMQFENGNSVKPGTEFNVTMKVKSPTGIHMLLDNSFAKVTESTASPYSVAYLQSMQADKTELAPGEETEMRLNFYLPDNAELYGKRLMVMVYVNYEEYMGEYVVPGNYMESIYFTAAPSSGINDTKNNGTVSYDIKGNTLTIHNINAGQTVELWSATGLLIKCGQAHSNRLEMAVNDLAPGVYIVRVRSEDHTCQSVKIAIK